MKILHRSFLLIFGCVLFLQTPLYAAIPDSTCTTLTQDVSAQYKYHYRMALNFGEQSPKSLEAFFKVITQDPPLALCFTRGIFQAADQAKLNVYGFLFAEGKSPQGDLCFYLSANKNAFDPPVGESLLLTQTYKSPHAFSHILEGKETAHREDSEDAISFTSLSGNYLIIPRGPYVSLYDFSKNASDKEILGFWNHAYRIKKKLDAQGIPFRLGAHTGSHAHQTVPHFHLRFEIKRNHYTP